MCPPEFPKEMPLRHPLALTEPGPPLSRTLGRVELECDPRTDRRPLEMKKSGRGPARSEQAASSAGESPTHHRVAHGALFVLLMAATATIPHLRTWPWLWLAPFLGYSGIVAVVPQLRGSVNWLSSGIPRVSTSAATIGLMAVTVLVLTRFQGAFHPDVSDLRAALSVRALGGIACAGVVFSLLNATLEEFVFRGILFDSLQARWGATITILVTSLLFGIGHLHGYPPGPFGACLAALFGLALGLLRLRTGGLALPITAHIAADATVYWILFHGL